MTEQHLIAPTRQAVEAKGRSAPRRVTGKLRIALEEMVWTGSRRAEAAKTAGLKDHSLREALRKPHVKAYYREQLLVLRESERARNLHRAAELREQDENRMAAMTAIKWLHEEDDTRPGMAGGRVTTPGVVINIGPRDPVAVDATIIEINPVDRSDDDIQVDDDDR